MGNPTLHLEPLVANSFRAYLDDDPDLVFTVRETTDGWKTEGHPAYDGLLCTSKAELVAKIEGRDER